MIIRCSRPKPVLGASSSRFKLRTGFSAARQAVRTLKLDREVARKGNREGAGTTDKTPAEARQHIADIELLKHLVILSARTSTIFNLVTIPTIPA